MIINWLLYSVLATTILVAAGFAFEYAVRALRWPTRWVWISVMILSTAFSVATLAKQFAPAQEPTTPEYVYNSPGGVPGLFALPQPTATETKLASIGSVQAAVGVDESSWMSFDAPLLIGCAVLAVIGLVTLCVIVARLNGVAYALNDAVVEGVPVLLSRNIGPALLGVFRFRVVLPGWVTQMPSSDLRTILKHEQEHALAGDPTLTLGALCIIALQPWNPAMWLALSRLRFSIESDCDARVLGSDGDVRQYGKLLVSVYERAQSGVMPLTALVTRTSQLEARIRRMVDKAPQSFSPKTAGALAMAFTLSVFAYSLEVTAQKSAPTVRSQQPPVVNRNRAVVSDSFIPRSQDSIGRKKARMRAVPIDTMPNALFLRKDIPILQSDTPPGSRRKVDSLANSASDDYKTRRVDSLRREYAVMRGSKGATLGRYDKPDTLRYSVKRGSMGSANGVAAARKQYVNSLSRMIQDSVNRANRMPPKNRGPFVLTRPITRADSLRNAKARAAYDVMTPAERRAFELRADDMRRAKGADDTTPPLTPVDSAPKRGSRASIKPYTGDSIRPRGSGGAVMRMPDSSRVK